MKWKDKPLLNKVAEVGMLLGIIAYFGLSYLRSQGEAVPAALPVFCIALVLFCLGISYWKISRKSAIVYFSLAAGVLALILILL